MAVAMLSVLDKNPRPIRRRPMVSGVRAFTQPVSRLMERYGYERRRFAWENYD